MVPPLKDRSLRLSKDKPALIYHYYTPRKCGFLNLGTCWDEHTDEYDLTDKSIRQNLIDLGFVMKARESL